jgi:hypothetical protein
VGVLTTPAPDELGFSNAWTIATHGLRELNERARRSSSRAGSQSRLCSNVRPAR